MREERESVECVPEPTRRRPPCSLSRTYGDPAAVNMAIRQDNLPVLEWMASRFQDRFRCIYIDPPFNTGRSFAEYDDARSADGWREMMLPRLRALKPLLARDGALFAHIDDTELGPLIALLDDVFGRENRVSTITVIRSAATGHKARNNGPVNVSDFILVYAKERRHWRPNPQWRPRRGFDRAYSTFLQNPSFPPSEWTFVPLRKHIRDLLKGAPRPTSEEAHEFALAHAEQVVRFAEPRFEAVSHEAQSCILRSRQRPDQVLVLDRRERPPLYLRGGRRILFLSSKVRTIDGKRVLVEPLTNVWDDIGFQGIASEGGVRFIRNKKPERLLERVISIATNADDWVLDPFLGSGTTAAVAHKMGRKWVGVEVTDSFDTMALPRLMRVVSGEDDRGISKRYGPAGGGFGVFL